jgi:outer membrane immunogenic protein
MFNTLWDYENHTKFTPYLGVGLGWAEHKAETTRSNGSTIRPEATANIETTTGNFIWSLMLGTKYSFAKNWNIDLGYRYADLGDVDMGPFANGGKVETEYVSHDFTIGVNYFF